MDSESLSPVFSPTSARWERGLLSVTFKMEMAYDVTAARDLTRKIAEGRGKQQGGVEPGR